MQKLKFRIWNKEKKEMYVSPDEIQHLGSWFDSHLPGAIANVENIVIMQYTGLKDKNGKEIYEGNIVKVTIHDGDYFNAQIIFEVGSFMIATNGDIMPAYFGDLAWNNNVMTLTELWWNQEVTDSEKIECLEIIGNIYEHPHLLGGDK